MVFQGGAEGMLFKVLSNINRKSFDPIVITLSSLHGYNSSIKKLNIPIINIGISKNFLSCFKLFKLFFILHRLSPAIIHTWMYHADLLGGLIAYVLKVPKIIWCVRHSDFSKSTVKNTTYLIMRFCALLSKYIPNEIVYCSSKAAVIHECFGYSTNKTKIIPNGFDLTNFCQSPSKGLKIRNELKISSDSILVGHVGRFHPQKNHLGFLKAICSVTNNFPDTHFLLVGKDITPSNKLLNNYILKNNLNSVVHLLGLRHDIPAIMASLDILVSSSTNGEAFPNVIGEAMSCGVPCVVTNVGDSVEIIGNSGVVADAFDSQDIAENIIKLINLPASKRLQLSNIARQRIKLHYDIRTVIKLYESLYIIQSIVHI